MTKLLGRLWDRLKSRQYDRAHLAGILAELQVGAGHHYRVTNRGAKLRLAGTQVHIPPGTLPQDGEIGLAPLTRGNVIAGIRLDGPELRLPVTWHVPDIGVSFSLRTPGHYLVVKEGQHHHLVPVAPLNTSPLTA